MPKWDSITGPFYTPFSSKADCQIAKNVYRERVESGEGVSAYTLLKSPGLKPYITDIPASANRGAIELNDHIFTVSGGALYDYAEKVQVAAYSPIANDLAPVQMCASQTTVMILAANTLYRLNGGALTVVAPPAGVTFISIAFGKNYFVAVANSLSQFYFSTDDGATFPAGNVQTAEADANKLLRVEFIQQRFAFIGNRITQWFYVVANANAPLAPIDSGVIRSGTIAGATVKPLGESLIWLERNKDGQNKVVMTNGFEVQRVSNHAIENKIREYARDFGIADAYANTFEMNGHPFYRITFPSADATWEFNERSGDWEQLTWFDFTSSLEHMHRGMSIVSAFDRILVGDRSNGIIYEMSPDLYHDFGYPLRSQRRTPHLVENSNNIVLDQLILGAETGMGLSTPLWLNDYSLDSATFAANLATAVGVGDVTAGQAVVMQQIYDVLPFDLDVILPGSVDVMDALGFYPWGAKSSLADGTAVGADPSIVLTYSTDGGKSFSNELSASLGASGEDVVVDWNRLGCGNDRVLDFFSDSPCRLAITTGWIEVAVLAS